MKFENTLKFARTLDKNDALRSFRNRFLVPKVNGQPSIYLTGNSLGLQPKATRQFLNEELQDWAALGVEGHVHARRPWIYYHKVTKKVLAEIVGARPLEVVAMNQLTINLHLMMVSFFRPTKSRYKIITEHGAFSSDQYAVESQLKYHGFNPEDALIELKPRPGEYVLRTDDIIKTIREHADQLALVLFGSVQYYTGQAFDISRITAAGHEAGAIVGFDLAHAVGNVPLNLHDDGVDFAVWCSYKYLNAGPGAIAGAFVHEKHAANTELPRFAGWWGHQEAERFQMKKGFKPQEGVDGWQLSNVPILQSAALLASLQIFREAGMKRLRKKSLLLTGYLEFIISQIDPQQKYFEVITPKQADERGCQLSVRMKQDGKRIFKSLSKAGVIADWREPDVIRVAPVPLYNTFEDVFEFGEILKKIVKL